MYEVYCNNNNRQLECLLSEEVRCCARGLMPCKFYKGLAFITIWLENADSQKKMPEALFYTGSFFLTKLHEAIREGLPSRKREKLIIIFDKKVRLIIFNLPDFSTYN